MFCLGLISDNSILSFQIFSALTFNPLSFFCLEIIRKNNRIQAKISFVPNAAFLKVIVVVVVVVVVTVDRSTYSYSQSLRVHTAPFETIRPFACNSTVVICDSKVLCAIGRRRHANKKFYHSSLTVSLVKFKLCKLSLVK